jgi:phage tail-like protein
MATYYPPVGFHFSVEFQDLGADSMDLRFQSVAGLSVEVQTEAIKEGGEHRFEHVLPMRSKYNNLVLKRGLVPSTALVDWCRETIETLVVYPKDVLVKLLDETHEPIMSWNVVQAWPLKWSVSDLDAETNSLVIETLELQYQYFTITLP